MRRFACRERIVKARVVRTNSSIQFLGSLPSGVFGTPELNALWCVSLTSNGRLSARVRCGTLSVGEWGNGSPSLRCSKRGSGQGSDPDTRGLARRSRSIEPPISDALRRIAIAVFTFRRPLLSLRVERQPAASG